MKSKVTRPDIVQQTELLRHRQLQEAGVSVSGSVELSSLNYLNRMRTSSQFRKIGIPLIVVSFLVAVAIILAIVLSKEVEEPRTEGKLLSSRGRDLVWRDFSGSTKCICPLYQGKRMPIFQPLIASLIMQLTRDKNIKAKTSEHAQEQRMLTKGASFHVGTHFMNSSFS